MELIEKFKDFETEITSAVINGELALELKDVNVSSYSNKVSDVKFNVKGINIPLYVYQSGNVYMSPFKFSDEQQSVLFSRLWPLAKEKAIEDLRKRIKSIEE